MPPRRLQIDDADGSGPRALRDVRPPLRNAGRAHSLAQVLEIVLEATGLSLGYDAVMGLSRLAFRTPAWPETVALTPEETADAVDTLSGALSGSLRLQAAHDMTPQELLRVVAESVDAGRPVAMLGWGSVKESWSVIAGYDCSRGRLLGHCLLDGPREQYESWPPSAEMVVAVEATPRPGGRQSVRQAIETGANRWQSDGRARLEAWCDALMACDEAPGSRHETAVELLADARAAAAGFCDAVAGLEQEIPAAWLRAAAEQYRALVEGLEARGVPHGPEATAPLASVDGRRAWARRLADLSRYDGEGARALRRAYTAQYPPEEARRA